MADTRLNRVTRRSAWLLAVQLHAVAGVMALAANARADCSKDSDCKGDRICEKGQCVAPAPPVAATPAPVPVLAPPPVAAPVVVAAPPLDAGGGDIVILADGAQLQGTVVRQEFGKFVIIRTNNGAEQTIDWAQVKQVIVAPRAGQPVSMGGVQPTVRTSTGEAVNFTFAPPPNFTVNFMLGGFARYAGATEGPLSLHIAGGGLEPAVTMIYGLTPFPDTHGGHWWGIHGVAFGDLWGGGIFGSDGDQGSGGGGFFAFHGGVGAGVAYISLNDIDLDYQQRGIGFLVDYRLGGQFLTGSASISTSGGDGGSGSISLSGFSHGPWFALLFPKYDAHRAHLSYGYVMAGIQFFNAAASLDGQSTGVSVGFTQFLLGGGGAF